jgi:membrane protein
MRGCWELLAETVQKWQRDKAWRLAAALAYYTLVSMAPMLVILVSIAGIVFGKQAAQGQIMGQLQGFVGADGARVLEDVLVQAHRPGASVMAAIAGVALLLAGASGVLYALQDALNRVWDVPEKPWSGLLVFMRDRLVPFLLILGIGLLLLLSLALSTAVAAAANFVGGLRPVPAVAVEIANASVSFAIITVLFAMVYKILPECRIPWGDVWIGSVATSLLFTLGKTLIGLYLGSAGVGSPYGAAGSVVVLLVWVYYSAQIFLFGAEFTRVYSRRRGSRVADRTFSA